MTQRRKRRQRAGRNRTRARVAALAARRRDRRSLTARLMGDPLPGRSALDRPSEAAPTVRPVRVEAVISPLLAVDLIEALEDATDPAFEPDAVMPQT